MKSGIILVNDYISVWRRIGCFVGWVCFGGYVVDDSTSHTSTKY